MKLYIVIPCYNEQEVLKWAVEKLQKTCNTLNTELQIEAHILLVDDGSKDNTWTIANELTQQYANVAAIKLSHNVGHQNALWAGMEQCVELCDAMVSIDADLQDDENAIIDMARYVKEQHCDIVYGVRKERKTDTFFKRFTAQSFYKLMQKADKETIYNHADFRMMRKRAVMALLEYPERNLFLRGLVRQLGFKEAMVYYNRTQRTAGESKYPLHKMLSFSIDGITSFSVAPLKFITFMGLGMTFISFCMIIFGIVEYFFGTTIKGWSSLMVSIWFVGGIITTGVGITGVYIGKIYKEVKRRPRYFVDQSINLK